jgi:membrane-bound lytic murein transglycosylase D
MTSSLMQRGVPTLKRGLGTALCLSTVSRRAHPLGWVRIATLAAPLAWLAACGGAPGSHAGAVEPAVRDSAAVHTVDSLGAAIARVAQDSAADQQALDSLHRTLPHADSTRPRSDSVAPPAVKGEEVEREAERLFEKEGKAVVGAAPSPEPTFDIDVSSFAMNRRVLQYLEFFRVDSRDRFEIWLGRLARYEGMIRARLRAKRLPEDLVYLTLVESGLSNTAVSRAKAVGMWQFMASTARLYGLTVDPWVDERRDPFKATEAAVNYLADLRERLGSVYLAAAAYNAGVGRIERGINRLPGGRGGSGGDPDSVSDLTFFQLADRRYLRRETRDYVPKLIAASLIAKQPRRYGFDDVQPLPPLAFDEVSVTDATGLDVIARLADTSVAAVLELNPQFVRGITPPGRLVVVRVPRGRGTHVAERYDSLPATDRITFVDHYVSRGQTLSEIAKRYRVTLAMLEGANPRIRSHALRVGQRIIIPMSGRIVPAGAWSTPPETRYRRVSRTEASRGSHRVQSGETVSEIARRYGVSLAALLNYNGLTMASVIRAGDVIKIPQK